MKESGEVTYCLNSYKVFSGSPYSIMRNLAAEGRTPLSVADVMDLRLRSRRSSEKLHELVEGHVTTGDGIVYLPENDRISVLFDTPFLSNLTDRTRTKHGALVLAGTTYPPSSGCVEIPLVECGFLEQPLTKTDALQHPLWKILLRHPDSVPAPYARPGLHGEVVDYVFNGLQGGQGMAIRLTHGCSQPTLRPLHIRKVDRGFAASGRLDVTSETRVIGVAAA